MSEASLPSDFVVAVARGRAVKQRFRLDGVTQLGIGTPLGNTGASYFEVFPLRELNETLAALAAGLGVASLVTTVVGAGAGLYSSRRVLMPLQRVSRASGRIADGALDTRLEADGDVDLQPLVDSFNAMADALQDRIEKEARFASDVSHEFRTPLTALATAVQVLQARAQEMPVRVRAALDVLESQIQYFERLVLDLLEISRYDAGVNELAGEEVEPVSFVRQTVAPLDQVPLRTTTPMPEAVWIDERARRTHPRQPHRECTIARLRTGSVVARPARQSLSGEPGSVSPSWPSMHDCTAGQSTWSQVIRAGAGSSFSTDRTCAMRMKVLLCLTLALSSCGVGLQANPDLFDSDEVPFGLIDTTPASPTAPTGSSPNLTTTSRMVAYDIYLIRSGVLVAVIRRTTSALTPADGLAALLEGPTPAEVTAGLRTALTGPDIISRTRSTATIVTVDLARTFNEIPRSDRILALGQITLTLTGQPGVTLIQYTIADAPIEVPKANGVVTRDPVARGDYVSLLQPHLLHRRCRARRRARLRRPRRRVHDELRPAHSNSGMSSGEDLSLCLAIARFLGKPSLEASVSSENVRPLPLSVRLPTGRVVGVTQRVSTPEVAIWDYAQRPIRPQYDGGNLFEVAVSAGPYRQSSNNTLPCYPNACG